jgi:membrane-associated protease RseP (regulator of RpoE activity)
VLADGNVATIQVKDTGANISRYLESMQGLGSQITQIEQTDASALTITASQYAANADALGKFKVAPSFNLTKVNAGAVSTLSSNGKILSLAVSDTSSNIAQYLDALKASAKVATITQVGVSSPLLITAGQLISELTIVFNPYLRHAVVFRR